MRDQLAASPETLMMASFVVLPHVPRVLAHADSRMERTMPCVAVTPRGPRPPTARFRTRQ